MFDALRRAHARGCRIISLCTGAFVLAEAGLLKGRRATTHWTECDELARRYPDVSVDPGVLYVDEGDILTSAGSAASIDLCLHIVRGDYGSEVATRLARQLVVPPQRDGGQAQYIDTPLPALDNSNLFADTVTWAQEHLNEPLTVADLAARSAMSPRTFARQFSPRPGPPRTNGCSASGSIWRNGSSRRATSRSSPWRKTVVSARPATSASTSAGSCTPAPRPTGEPSSTGTAERRRSPSRATSRVTDSQPWKRSCSLKWPAGWRPSPSTARPSATP